MALNLSDRATVLAGPIFYLVSRLKGSRVLHRQFGGEFDLTLASLHPLTRWWVRRTVLSADAVFLQTRRQMERLSGFCRNPPLWFPTARPRAGCDYQGEFASGRSEQLRCVFVGHVSAAKGVLRAARAVSKISNAHLDIYGPLVDITAAQIEAAGATYHRELQPDEVQRVLASYDLLVFATVYPGEGYPGVLVEAAHVGLPSVVSRWQSIPEMFTEQELVFVTPKDDIELEKALAAIARREIDLNAFSARIRARSPDYDARAVFRTFAETCRSIVAD